LNNNIFHKKVLKKLQRREKKSWLMKNKLFLDAGKGKRNTLRNFINGNKVS
jgi:hypothetical protein